MLARAIYLAALAATVHAVQPRGPARFGQLNDLLARGMADVPVVGLTERGVGVEERAPAAGTYSAVIAIGASYMDNGHARASQYSSSLQPAPYVGGRKSDGPVFVEQLATSLGANLFDYAFVGAFNDQAIAGSSTSVPTTRDQVASYIADANGGSVNFGSARRLVVIWQGINANLAAWNTAISAGNTAAAKATAQATIDANAQALLNQMTSIRSNTANCNVDFLVLAIPPLETVPNVWYAANYDQAKLDTMSMLEQRYNAAVLTGGAAMTKSWSKVTTFALRDLWYDATYNPSNYGLTVGTAPCYDGTNVCSSRGTYLYWDSLHPSTAFHKVINQKVLAVL